MLGSRLKIKTVKIEVDEHQIKSVQIGGRTNIFDHEDVRMFTEDRDGRLVSIKGEMKYKGQDFYFQCGYDDKFGRLTVEKKGKRNGNLAIVEEAYDFLDQIYREHFIDQ